MIAGKGVAANGILPLHAFATLEFIFYHIDNTP